MYAGKLVSGDTVCIVVGQRNLRSLIWFANWLQTKKPEFNVSNELSIFNSLTILYVKAKILSRKTDGKLSNSWIVYAGLLAETQAIR